MTVSRRQIGQGETKIQSREKHQSMSEIGRKAKELLQRCQEQHTSCQYCTAYNEMPTRMLCLRDNNVRLVSSDNIGEAKPYATLSYCWGPDKQEHSLTTENQCVYHNGIQENELPKTLKDTIDLLRLLHIEYVWIDSMCILQDSHEDWLNESKQMHKTYSSAYLCVSALYGQASTSGLFGMQKSKTNDHKISSKKSSFMSLFDSFPLNHRCWTLQERLLSRRLLHVTGSDIWLECRVDLVRYNYNDESLYTERPRCSGTFLELSNFARVVLSLAGRIEKAEAEILASWYQVVMEYCPRKLSHESDRLIAIDGIRNLYQGYMNCDYFHGLWRDDIYNGLLWFNGEQALRSISKCIVDPLAVPLFHAYDAGDVESPSFYSSMILKEGSDRRLYKEDHTERSVSDSQAANSLETSSPEMVPSWSWAAAGRKRISFCYVDSQKWLVSNNIERLRVRYAQFRYLRIGNAIKPCLELNGTIASIEIEDSTHGNLIAQLAYHFECNEIQYRSKGRSNVFFDQESNEKMPMCKALLVYQAGFSDESADRSHYTLLLLQEIPELQSSYEIRIFKRIGMAFFEALSSKSEILAHIARKKREKIILI